MADIPTNDGLDGSDLLNAPPVGEVYTTGSLIPAAPQVTSRKLRLSRRSVMIALSFLLIALLVAGLIFWVLTRSRQQQNNTAANSGVSSRYLPLNVTLDDLAKDGSLVIDSAPSLSINGQLKINNSLVIGPTSPPPADGVTGQIYYDPQLNVLRYFNGSSFTSLLNDKTPMVSSLGGVGGNISLGAGLSLANGQLSAATAIPSAVTSVQGRTGSINFTSGGGIAINGTTLSNTGITGLGGQTGNISLGQGLAINNGSLSNTGVNSLTSGTPSLLIADDGSGNLTITDSSSGSSGVTSPGGTTNRLAKFTGAQTIGDSSISDNGTLVSITGDLAVSGGLALGTLLSVGNGGTGAASLANNGILLGQGTGPLTAVTAAGSGLCLVSTAGAPAFQACPGSGSVISVNSLTGALNIANSSGSGATITIDDASTTQKGIAQFNGTNFAVGGGIVNTIQDISTGATPTFAGVNATTGYQVNNVSGASATCNSGQFLENATVSGGIITGTNCASAVGDGGITTIGAIDTQVKSANGAVIAGTNLYMQTADATNPGLVSTGTQTFAGDKTFNGAVTVNSGATIQGVAAADILTLKDSSGNPVATFGQFGDLYTPTQIAAGNLVADTYNSTTPSLVLKQNSAGATVAVAIIRGGATPGAGGDLLQLQNSTNTTVASVDAAGNINTTGVYKIGGTSGVAITCTGGQLLQNATTVGGIVTAGSCVAGGAGGVTTVGTIDTQTKSINGAVISGTSIYMQTADASNPGLVSTGVQTIAGAKTFSGAITASSTYNTNTFTGSTLTFGSATGAAINAASGQALTVSGNALTLSAASAQAINIGTVNNNTITLGTTTATGTITLGQSTASNIVNIGSGTIAAGNTGTVNIGTSSTSTGKTVVTIGSTNDGSSTTLQAGTGNINLTSIGTTGGTIVKSATSNSTGAFQVQNLSNVAILNYDTTVNRLSLRASSATSSALNILNSDGTTALEVRSGGSGQSNTLTGLNAGAAVTSGTFNAAFGAGALQSMTSGQNNVAVGSGSLADLLSGSSNTAIGSDAANNTTGGSNTAIGAAALYTNISGASNTAIGKQALYASTGSFNVAIGDGAAINTTSNYTTSIGYNALYSNTSGISNTAVGNTALYQNTGDYNTAIGSNAGYNLITGNYNTFIGTDAGNIDSDGFATKTNLSGTIVIGIQAQAQADSSLILGGTGNQVVNVGFGTTKPENRFSVSPVIYGAGGLAGNTTTASQTGTTVTGTGTSWLTVNTVKVGQQLIFASGASAYITSVNSNTSLTVDVSQTVGSQRYRIHDPSLQVAYNGNVGIGTSNIGNTYRLDIANANDDSLMRIYQDDGQYSEMVLQTDNSNFDLGVGGTNSAASDSGSFFIYDDNDGTYGMSLDGSGNVGIGNLAGNQSTTTLDVNGLIRVRNPNGETTAPTRANNGEFAFADLGTTNQRLYFRSNGANYYINRSGTGDYSEYFLKQDKNESLKPGYLTTMDNGKVTKATQKNSVLGVVSAYGTRNNDDLKDGLRGQDPAYANIGVLGQLPVIVSSENGKITAGDPIANSSKLVGIGTKMGHPGMIAGRTTQDFNPDGSSCAAIASIESAPWTAIKENSGPDAQCFRLPDGTLVGRVLAYINAQYYTPPMQGNDINNLQSDIKNLGVSLQTKKATIGDLKVTGSATINGKLVVRGLTEVQDLQLDGHLITKGGKPAIKLMAAAGTTSNVSITGNDSAGTITLVVGDNPKADDLVKLTFSKTFGITPQIVITPIGKTSTALEPYINDPSSKGFTLGSLQAPQAGHTYKFTYYAVQ